MNPPEIYTTDIIQLVDKYIQTGRIKAISGQQIQIQASNGQLININTDGTVTFPSFVVVDSAPTDNNHLTNKLYVDTEINDTKTSLETLINNRVDNVENELETYTDTEFSNKNTNLTNYIDTEVSDLKTAIESYTDTETTTAYNNLTNYTDNEISNIEGNLQSYTDAEVSNVVSNVYPVLEFTINTWTSSEGLYYSDITHNKGKTETVVRCWSTENDLIFPEKIESLDMNNIRI